MFTTPKGKVIIKSNVGHTRLLLTTYSEAKGEIALAFEREDVIRMINDLENVVKDIDNPIKPHIHSGRGQKTNEFREKWNGKYDC